MSEETLTHVAMSSATFISLLIALVAWLGKRNVRQLDDDIRALKASGEHIEAMFEDMRRETTTLREKGAADREFWLYRLGEQGAMLAKLSERIDKVSEFWRQELREHLKECHPK